MPPIGEKGILAFNSLDQLRKIWPHDLIYREGITQNEIVHILKLCGAFWMHSGDPRAPHAELTSGLCSNGYINMSLVLCYPNLCAIFAEQLAHKLIRRMGRRELIDWVVGSSYAAIDLSHDVARFFNAKHGVTEKGENKTQVWGRGVIGPEEKVLQVEELMTTGETTEAVRVGIEEKHPYPIQFFPFVLVAIHRSDVYQVSRCRGVLYLTHFDIWTKEPSECPLCAQGSKRLRPKNKENWARLCQSSL